MSNIIPSLGEYVDTNGLPCRVVHIEGGWAFGFYSDGAGGVWECEDGYSPYYADIKGPKPPDPPTPPEGFQLADRETHKYRREDKIIGNRGGWLCFDAPEHVGLTAVEFDAKYPREEPFYIASPIPKPFSISEHGPGVYETRDGRRATVNSRLAGTRDWWNGTVHGSGRTWKEDGWYPTSGPCTEDLVRYIGPLEEPWVATDMHRETIVASDGTTWTKTWCGFVDLPKPRRIEQKFTRGTEEQWREVTP